MVSFAKEPYKRDYVHDIFTIGWQVLVALLQVVIIYIILIFAYREKL